jgi:hypothetical protein
VAMTLRAPADIDSASVARLLWPSARLSRAREVDDRQGHELATSEPDTDAFFSCSAAFPPVADARVHGVIGTPFVRSKPVPSLGSSAGAELTSHPDAAGILTPRYGLPT